MGHFCSLWACVVLYFGKSLFFSPEMTSQHKSIQDSCSKEGAIVTFFILSMNLVKKHQTQQFISESSGTQPQDKPLQSVETGYSLEASFIYLKGLIDYFLQQGDIHQTETYCVYFLLRRVGHCLLN